MKKLVMLALAAICAMGAYAQKGESAVGVGASYASKFENVALGVKYQYNITDPIRLEASFDYFLKKNYTTMWDINVNANYLFPLSEKFNVYPLAGVVYNNVKVSYEGFSASDSNFGVNLGAGLDYKVSTNFKLGVEAKYQIISNLNQFVVGVTAAYVF